MTAQVEQHSFQAEVNEVLSIVVNSLYSHKEIFLRELISNASDALDKFAFRALTDEGLSTAEKDLRIDLQTDVDGHTLTISDTGIGMTKQELIDNLGTIAKSGSKELMKSLSGDEKKDLSLIGQFGVGFYSAFLVADKVTVTSRCAGEDTAWTWESAAHGEFTLQEAERDAHGTDIVLTLKEDAGDFLQEWTIRGLVRKYSDYVRYPIRLEVTREEKGEDEETTKVTKWETINTASALWTRSKSDVEDEEYQEFYKHLSHDWDEPLAHTHFKVEGTQELTGLLFLPSKAPVDLFQKRTRGIRLYVKRVFIMEDCEEILPEWLRFIRGVVDSEDLPLNVSREILQQERTTQAIRKQVINKVLTMLEDLNPDDYEICWSQFGRVLKEGVHYDPTHKDRIAGLLRYESSRNEGQTSLQDYVDRMPEDQTSIYYVTAETLDTARNSPQIEALKKSGYEVLFMTDPVDEWVVGSLAEFAEKPLTSAARGSLDLPESDADKDAKEQKSTELKSVLEKVQGNLDEQVSEVRVTNRLTDSPACLVTDEQGISPYMEKILKASGQDVPESKRILELNPNHPVVQRLQQLADGGRDDDVSDWSQLLFDQALVAEGNLPEDPARFARNVTKLMQRASD